MKDNMVKMHMQVCSTLFIIRELEIEKYNKVYYTPNTMAKIFLKIQQYQMVMRM